MNRQDLMEVLLLWKEGAKAVMFVVLVVAIGAVAAQIILQPKLAGDAAVAMLTPVLSETVATLKDTHASVDTIKDLTKEIKTDYEANQNNMTANTEAATVLIRSLTDTVSDTHTQLFGGNDCRPAADKLSNGWAKLNCVAVPGLFTQSSQLLSDARSWMAQLQADTHSLMTEATVVMASTDAALGPLRYDLEKLGTLETTLNDEIKVGSAHAQATADELTSVLQDADKILQDPGITGIIANLNKTTGSAGEVMKTLDVSTRDLRKKVGQVKWIITTLSNYLKGTIRIY